MTSLTKLGWKLRESRGAGFVRKPDAFDAAHLPPAEPAKVTKKK